MYLVKVVTIKQHKRKGVLKEKSRVHWINCSNENKVSELFAELHADYPNTNEFGHTTKLESTKIYKEVK